MPDSADSISDIDTLQQRKKEGIRIPLTKDVQAKTSSNYLEYVKLIHNALPELDYDGIETSCTFLNRRLGAPIMIDSMTGGTPDAIKINSRLGQLAEKYGIAMGLGSQRAGLRSAALAETYSVARSAAPNAFLIANIGGAQLSKGLSIDEINSMIEMIKADALAIHLNPLQELVQPEGEPKYKGVLARIKEIVKVIDVPVIVKEVGAGISKEVAKNLENAGVAAINIAGHGGTSWAGVEKLRAELAQNAIKTKIGELFWDWGIPTALSLIEVRNAVRLPLIASGGIRNGLEVAKCIVLGANVCAMAYPFLKKADESLENLLLFTETLVAELKSTMFLVGAQTIEELKVSRYTVTGNLKEEISQ
ncbi:MAG: type 2 isopentenyl-diphosphate Delta-isomerase [Thermoproteota archaeon]|nr:type 2 isopentenyl-diphosphate Delta-isomerase [Thermoproteota archaeon]